MQGKDALVAKFRNSTVMIRPLEQRPRVSVNTSDCFPVSH